MKVENFVTETGKGGLCVASGKPPLSSFYESKKKYISEGVGTTPIGITLQLKLTPVRS